jgi:uncharacterized membrane protein
MPARRSTKARRGFSIALLIARPATMFAFMTASSECADPQASFSPLFFERVLSPHRSLPAGGFHLLMGLLGLLRLAVGIGFVSVGAWPVIGFFGLDVVLVYLAFRLSYRSARQSETLRLAGDAFTVERVSVRGERRSWRFQPFWLRVFIEERPDASNRLLIASHGRSLVIGDFVPPATRRDLAAAITEALGRWRKSFNPAVVDDER